MRHYIVKKYFKFEKHLYSPGDIVVVDEKSRPTFIAHMKQMLTLSFIRIQEATDETGKQIKEHINAGQFGKAKVLSEKEAEEARSGKPDKPEKRSKK